MVIACPFSGYFVKKEESIWRKDLWTIRFFPRLKSVKRPSLTLSIIYSNLNKKSKPLTFVLWICWDEVDFNFGGSVWVCFALLLNILRLKSCNLFDFTTFFATFAFSRPFPFSSDESLSTSALFPDSLTAEIFASDLSKFVNMIGSEPRSINSFRSFFSNFF